MICASSFQRVFNVGVPNRTMKWRERTGIKTTCLVSRIFFWGDVTMISKKTTGGKVPDWLSEQTSEISVPPLACLQEVTRSGHLLWNSGSLKKQSNLIKAAFRLLCYRCSGTGDGLRDCTSSPAPLRKMCCSAPTQEWGILYCMVCVGEVRSFTDLDFTSVKWRYQCLFRKAVNFNKYL